MQKEESGLNGKLFICIYACEESSRFGIACLGSKFLKGEISEKDFTKICDQRDLKEGKKTTLASEVEEYRKAIKKEIPDVVEVDKIFERVDFSFETHIEQYQILKDLEEGPKEKQKKREKRLKNLEKRMRKQILRGKGRSKQEKTKRMLAKRTRANVCTVGVVDSIGSSVRYKFNIPAKKEKDVPDDAETYDISYSVNGEANHSGSTPMDKRMNPLIETAILIQEIKKLNENIGQDVFSITGLSTKDGSFNQIPNGERVDIRITIPNEDALKREDYVSRLENVIAQINSREGRPQITKVEKDGGQKDKTVRPALDMDLLLASAGIVTGIDDLGKSYETGKLGRASVLKLETDSSGNVNGIMDIRLLGENTWEKAEKDVRRIFEEVGLDEDEIITRVSQGNPVITSKKLNESAKAVCKANHIQCIEMPSWAGQDTGYIPVAVENGIGEKTMLFIASDGGSHNKDEITWEEDILNAIDVLTLMTYEELKEPKRGRSFREGVRVDCGKRKPIKDKSDRATAKGAVAQMVTAR